MFPRPCDLDVDYALLAMVVRSGDFVEPPWSAPLDPEAVLRAVPPDATMTGTFLAAVVEVAASRGVVLPSARARYTAFQRFPLREHCTLLVEASRALFPELPLRAGLRKLGRGAPHALTSSTLGRVVFGSAEGPLDVIRAMAHSYSMHMSPSTLSVERVSETSAIVELSDIYNFLDSHNVGVFEGVLKHAGVSGTVKIRSYSRTAADMLCTWG
ncbi:MAG TPA: DUF2378 family protein [Polyangiaceae bacterium]|nr:DUF2378 family protein [Polyangiaceae bacterium]